MKNLILATTTAILLGSCNSGNLYEYTIASQDVDCMGVAPQKCLLVKKGTSTEWEYFYSPIEGFTYEPNFEYTLQLRIEDVPNTPQDASSVKYTLVKELKKEAKTSENLPIATNQQQRFAFEGTAKVLALEKEPIGSRAAQGRREVVVAKLEISSSTNPAIKSGSIVYAELVASPTVMPVIDREYVFTTKDLHPAHAKGIYLLDTNAMDLTL
ncbi:DUF4377 domain-containing protein [Flavobacterium sp. JP2137]|uniref:DUF4377 domain-containing protein n=1 Tax=Flavobacterium sp. JP2137 TaxID=3414510 RepID=UPI003D2FBF6E